MLKRRLAASSTLRSIGLWLPMSTSLNCGRYSKKSCRMNLARMVSPPVICLIRLSTQARPSSVSDALTMRAPWSMARSVGCLSVTEAVKLSIAAVVA